MNSCGSSRGPGSLTQHTHGGSQLSVASDPPALPQVFTDCAIPGSVRAPALMCAFMCCVPRSYSDQAPRTQDRELPGQNPRVFTSRLASVKPMTEKAPDTVFQPFLSLVGDSLAQWPCDRVGSGSDVLRTTEHTHTCSRLQVAFSPHRTYL